MFNRIHSSQKYNVSGKVYQSCKKPTLFTFSGLSHKVTPSLLFKNMCRLFVESVVLPKGEVERQTSVASTSETATMSLFCSLFYAASLNLSFLSWCYLLHELAVQSTWHDIQLRWAYFSDLLFTTLKNKIVSVDYEGCSEQLVAVSVLKCPGSFISGLVCEVWCLFVCLVGGIR